MQTVYVWYTGLLNIYYLHGMILDGDNINFNLTEVDEGNDQINLSNGKLQPNRDKFSIFCLYLLIFYTI